MLMLVAYEVIIMIEIIKYTKRVIKSPKDLTDEEKDIYLMGYSRAMKEMEGLRKAIIDLATNYRYNNGKSERR